MGPSMVGFSQFNYMSPANKRTKGIWPKTAFSPRKAKISLYGLKDPLKAENCCRSWANTPKAWAVFT